jgi:hypothetical protein
MVRNRRAAREVAGYFVQPEECWEYRWPLSRAGLSRISQELPERFKREMIEEAVELRTEQDLWLNVTALIGVGVRE